MSKKSLAREHQTVQKMITLYCRAHHNPTGNQLCADCESLAAYAHQRLDRCPFGVNKPTCANCPVHCYQPDRREQIRKIMRYAGPRMLFHHPILALLHLIDNFRKLSTR